ncbi:MAG TPA: PEGA domain-containing protein [Thermoanaerobaculia bacterium]|nr:PEGA domain-containing protein [Thermoanaerobaculia bacterium]
MLAATVGALLLGGCGTILHGRSDDIFVDSNPSGAEARIICIGGSARGTTPAKLTIPRRAHGCNLTVERDGYKAQHIGIERGFSRGYWANFAVGPVLFMGVMANRDSDLTYEAVGALLAGGVGFLVDRMTGAKYDNDPEEIVVELEPAWGRRR